ncbi:MAG TPA: DUF402 domain-containing protein [Streptosporangiaceae bacterium]
MTTLPVCDYDFHPDEGSVRVFTAGPGGVLRTDTEAFASASRYGDVVLWHYAFARHWFKVNLTTGLDGRLVETGGPGRGGCFTFNCDVATPMHRQDGAIYAVDLFTDVLVQADGVTFQVCDLDEFQQAATHGLILPAEAHGAQRGLAELTGIIERSELLEFLGKVCPIGPLNPPAASPVRRVPLPYVPPLTLESRSARLRSP